MNSSEKKRRLEALKSKVADYSDPTRSNIDVSNMDEKSIKVMIENFQVYQAELEAQKEELDESNLRNQQLSQEYSDLFERSPIGYVVLDENDRIKKSNAQARLILDLLYQPKSEQFFTGRIKASGGMSKFLNWVHSDRVDTEPLHLQIEEEPAKWVSLRRVNDVNAGTLLSIRDITEEKSEQDRLIVSAHYDPLTYLPNRYLLQDRLEQAMKYALRHRYGAAVLFIDLDGFKQINDTWGHTAGDFTLQQVANQLNAVLREVDTLARFGGDEFVAVLQLNEDYRDVPHELFSRMLERVATPFQYEGASLQVSASLGVSFFPQEQEIEAEDLIRQADKAMYLAKVNGKNRYVIFGSE